MNRLKELLKTIFKVIIGLFIIYPIVLILLFLIIMKCCTTNTYTVYEPASRINYKLERLRRANEPEDSFPIARLYISRSDKFEEDYVEFSYITVSVPVIHYVAPDTIYVVDENSFFVRDIRSKQFVIKKMDLITPFTYKDNEEYEKSIELYRANDSVRASLKARSNYTIRIRENAAGFSLIDSQNNEIVKDWGFL